MPWTSLTKWFPLPINFPSSLTWQVTFRERNSDRERAVALGRWRQAPDGHAECWAEEARIPVLPRLPGPRGSTTSSFYRASSSAWCSRPPQSPRATSAPVGCLFLVAGTDWPLPLSMPSNLCSPGRLLLESPGASLRSPIQTVERFSGKLCTWVAVQARRPLRGYWFQPFRFLGKKLEAQMGK